MTSEEFINKTMQLQSDLKKRGWVVTAKEKKDRFLIIIKWQTKHRPDTAKDAYDAISHIFPDANEVSSAMCSMITFEV